MNHIVTSRARTMRRINAFIVLFLICSATAFAQEKRRVAVMDFNYAAVSSSVAAMFGTNQDVGKGIVDLLIDRLVNDGTYRVMERQAMSKLITEQNFSNSNRADPASAAKIGKLLGVDTIIVGDITQFGRDDKNTNAGGAGGVLGHYGLGGVGVHKSKAIVLLSPRAGRRQHRRDPRLRHWQQRVLALRHGPSQAAAPPVRLVRRRRTCLDMGSSNFAQDHHRRSCKSLCLSASPPGSKPAPLSFQSPQPPLPLLSLDSSPTPPETTSSSTLARRQAMHVGDKLTVTRVTRVIKDPTTGKPLRSHRNHARSTHHHQRRCKLRRRNLHRHGTPKVGDTAKTP